MKLVDISETKRRKILKLKLMNLKLTVGSKNFRDLYWGISDIMKGCQPRTNIVKDEKVDLVTYPTVFD